MRGKLEEVCEIYTYELKCLKNSKGNFVVVEIKGKSETKISIYDFTANRAIENCVICGTLTPYMKRKHCPILYSECHPDKKKNKGKKTSK